MKRQTAKIDAVLMSSIEYQDLNIPLVKVFTPKYFTAPYSFNTSIIIKNKPEKIKIVDKSEHKIKVEKTSFIGKEYKIKGTLNKDEIYFYNSVPIKKTNKLYC